MLQKLLDSLSHWKTKLANTIREYEERNQSLRKEKEQILGHFKSLKGKMTHFRKSERKRLTQLTLNAQNAIGELEARKARAERILRLFDLCRKLETQQERVSPFASLIVDNEIIRKLQKQLEDSSMEEVGLEFPSQFAAGNMHFFYRRYAKVVQDLVALKEESKILEDDNLRLRSGLQQYLDGQQPV